MLQFGIPAYRLPRNIVARETGRLEEMGVRFVFNHKVENVLAEQRAGAFDAVYVAVGAQANRHVDIPGEGLGPRAGGPAAVAGRWWR